MSGIIFGGKDFTTEEAEKLHAMCRERKVSMHEAVRALFGIVLLMGREYSEQQYAEIETIRNERQISMSEAVKIYNAQH